MATREQVVDGVVVYTCNCGWFDTGHANSKSFRPNVGAESLWKQVSTGTGKRSTKAGESGFQVRYVQDMKKWGISASHQGVYFVKSGLSNAEKESVALAIFMEVSIGFEAMQGSLPWSLSTNSKKSSFSEEDLVSNLIGFYLVVRPGTSPLDLCKPVSTQASLAVWDNHGGGTGKNYDFFSPKLYPCDECKGPNKFPQTFQQIIPAKKGTLFRDWTIGMVSAFSNPTGTVDETFEPPPEYGPKY